MSNYTKSELYFSFGHLMKPGYLWGSWFSHITPEGGSKVSENIHPNCTF